jgi:hypothetical protein
MLARCQPLFQREGKETSPLDESSSKPTIRCLLSHIGVKKSPRGSFPFFLFLNRFLRFQRGGSFAGIGFISVKVGGLGRSVCRSSTMRLWSSCFRSIQGLRRGAASACNLAIASRPMAAQQPMQGQVAPLPHLGNA